MGAPSCVATAPGATLAKLQNRAVFDLGCPSNSLAVYHVDSRTKAVTGCGRRLLYVESCQQIRGEHACTWVMNTPTFMQTMWPSLLAPQPTTVIVQQRLPAPSSRPVATALFDPGNAPLSAGPSRARPSSSDVAIGGAGPDSPAGAAAGKGAAVGEVEGRPYSTDLFDATPSPRRPAPSDGDGDDQTQAGPRPARRNQPDPLYDLD
jgi:hypothetical protein